HYSVTIVDDGYADLVISLVVAIDYVEMMEAASSS
ncbi:MAG TPA: UDP-N-acetylenolpyruvoylglucosamine reductase, partial [Streptococcus sp.]|nr:UDP-N-acetylenolpyruvoylglucosamine reductase [Streptococcus sp.]